METPTAGQIPRPNPTAHFAGVPEGNPTVDFKSTSTLHRYRRPSAITLTAVCVLAGGGIATAAPASASETAVTPVAATTVIGPLPWRAGSQPLVWTQPVHRAPVRRFVSHLTAAAITPSKTTVRPGVAVTLTGTVSYGAAVLVRAQLVTLQVQKGSSWQAVETQRLSGTGSATFTVKPTGSQTYRLTFGGSRGLTPAISPPTKITVAAPVAAVASTGSGYRATSLAFSNITGGTGL